MIKTKFEGKQVFEVPKSIPTANYLAEDFGKEVNQEVQSKYKDFSAINKIGYSGNFVKGSNPFYVVAVNEVIRPEGLSTATPADLERILKTKALDLKRFYEDSALVLRSDNEPNQYLARKLIKELKSINPKAKLPVMIHLNQLDLVKDQDSQHGLAFKLREDTEIIYAPILNKETGNFSSEDIDEKTGLPKKLGGGNRTLYTMKNGLARLCLDRDLGLYSRDVGLAYSYGLGRVVVVSGEATKNFSNEYKIAREDYFSKLRRIKENIDKELNK